jgi:hypothetical protein
MSKLLTPLVIGTTLAVMALGITRLLLIPETWVSSVLALLFLPVVIGVVLARHHTGIKTTGSIRVSGKLRAGLVGGGVLLATALLESMIETLGLLPGREDGISTIFVVAVPALIAVGIDLFSARLEKSAEKDRD